MINEIGNIKKAARKKKAKSADAQYFTLNLQFYGGGVYGTYLQCNW
jgi:hypothetical protein